jgi:hypothetical protein
MGLLPPGVAQGILNAQQQQMADAKNKQAMEYQAWKIEQAKQAQARQTQAQQNYGGVLNAAYGGMAPPPVAGSQGPQPPAPGQASVPMAPPVSPNGGMGGMQGSAPPMAQGIMPGESGGMPTRAPMAPSGGMGGLPPYQTVQSLAQGQPPQAGGMDLMQPPPMPATNDIGTKPLTVASVVQLLKAQGVPQEQWYDTMSEMKPLFDEQNKQELLQLKTQMDATKMANDVYKAVLSGENIESLIASRGKAGEGKWVTKNVQRGNTIVPVQFNSVTGEEREIPGETGGGKWNPNAPTAQMTNVPLTPAGQKAKSGLAATGQNVRYIDNKTLNDMGADAEASGTSVADVKAGYKADTAALTANTKALAAIEPFKKMLDTNIDIAKNLSKKVISTNSAYANKSLNWIKQNAGDNPDTAEFLAQMRFVETEAARVLNNPNLTGQLTDSARREMESVVSGNLPINSLDRVLARIKSDGDNRVKSLEDENKKLRKANAKPAAASTTSADDALINKYLK